MRANIQTPQIPELSSSGISQSENQIPTGEQVKNILKTTQGCIEPILNGDNQIKIKEILCRPAEVTTLELLKQAEESNTTFDIFMVMLAKIRLQSIEDNDESLRYAINAYPFDIIHGQFINTVGEDKFSYKLIIELTEKCKWSAIAILRLKHMQKEYGVQIAMDDIHPTASGVNYSMKTLEKFRNFGVIMDIGKLDGHYFHEVFDNNDYTSLKDFILYNIVEYNIKEYVIEFIENEEQYQFALQLENDFPEITFGYQGYLFDQDKYKKTIS